MTTLEEEYQKIMEWVDQYNHIQDLEEIRKHGDKLRKRKIINLLTRYREALAKERERALEEAANILETMGPNFALPGAPLDKHPLGRNSEDSAQIKYANAIRKLKGTGHD